MNKTVDESLNRLMEFGFEFAAAQEMMRAMNSTFNYKGLNTPGVMNNLTNLSKNTVKEQIYFIVFEGKSAGPYSSDEISKLVMDHKITKETYIWKPGMSEWKKASDVPDVLKYISMVPPPVPEV